MPTDTQICCAVLLCSMLGLAPTPSASAAETASCANCGVITSIQTSAQEEQWAPLGVVSAGPTIGSPNTGEVRSAFAFSKDGSAELVMIGAAGGAVYSKRPKSYQQTRWQVTVKMDDGNTRVLQQRYEPFVHEGDRVRVMGTQVEVLDP